ncbi:class I adenylate-forming enzyme family protein [Corynebacterium epidermidicanis]|uniref:Acyl-CoA synthetase (AMP-forming)/AMP-acid ligase II n=1 Tax=Corynebacterium epidermidicanis TaxID=1050174 RepID=A0A0G3GTI7_9CORY|nr:AMP-binding protein [Corynebacterium epidermidicanis]AKK03865.1 acyl-CoA synthetase (AMP-forming)/AMP-acid ligase II [Corynebacterium epidermidicanis]
MNILPSSLYDAVFGGALPEQEAIIDSSGSWTYPQLAELIDDVAARLYARGVRPHHVVGIQLGNGSDFAIAFHAIAKLGAVVTPLGAHITADDRAAQLRAADATMLLTATDLAQLRAPRGGLAAPVVQINPEQLVCLPFSSGTTGSPKAVMLPHRALSANIQQFGQVLPLSSGETCLSVLPYSHIYGLTALLNVPLALRARIMAQDFERESFLTAHERHHVALTFIAPPLATLLARDPLVDTVDFSALHTVVSGAAPLNVATAKVAEQRIGARIIQGFGLTEASPVTHLAWQPGTSLGSIGHPLPGTEISVRDPKTGTPVTEGEMWVRGPQIMKGYLGDPLATSAALVDGWLRTGDLVRVLADGSVEVVDRLKDVIKSHGFQVSPVKLEQLLLSNPHVVDAAVVRGYGTNGEERPEAFVVLGSPISDDELIEWFGAQVAPYERIRSIRQVREIPRSASGKILRRLLTS